ncbi:MAG TPA: sodium:solute symporter family protein [Anaerovoracaceae bacterium]|nr:sodium:solute symporter family protein [Anaerovoracaceae bacterium]
MTMDIFLWGVLGSFALYLFLGFYAGRKVKNTTDYYVAGRNAPTILITGTLFASMLSTNAFMGDTGWCYTGNITSAVLLNALCGSGYVIGLLFFSRYLRRSECNTMPEYFGTRFNDMKNRRMSAIILVMALTAYLLAVMTGTGILLEELTGLSRTACLVIAWVTFTSFTFYSGSKGVILTDTVMFLIFVGASILAAPFLFYEQGGLGQLLTNLMNNPDAPAGLLDYHGSPAGTYGEGTSIFNTVMYAIAFGIVWLITVGISPWQAGRIMMAKNEHVGLRSASLACILTTVFCTLTYLMAISVINLNPNMEDSQRVLIWAAYNAVPKVLGMLILTGIMAAGLSSATTFLSVVGFSVTSDIIKIDFKSDKQKLDYSRLVMIAVGVIALVLALFNVGGIRVITWFASTLIACSWCVSAFGSVWSKTLTARGSRWSMMAGLIGFLVAKSAAVFGGVSLMNWMDPFFIGLYLSAIFAVIGSKTSSLTQEEIDYRLNLHILPISEQASADYRVDKNYGKVLIVFGVATTVFLLFGWALPYNGLI